MGRSQQQLYMNFVLGILWSWLGAERMYLALGSALCPYFADVYLFLDLFSISCVFVLSKMTLKEKEIVFH